MEHKNSNSEELIMKASLLERHSLEIEQKIEYISQQLLELEEFYKHLELLSKSSQKEIFSSIGKGIYAKSLLKDNKIFVNVGAGVLVKKTPQETQKIIESQIKSFYEAKNHLLAEMEACKNLLFKTMQEIENTAKKD